MEDVLLAIQRLYPQVYHACHRRHPGTRHGSPISERDQSLLAHLSLDEGLAPGDLARHFGVAPSTVSEALARLEALGLVARERSAVDRRAVSVRLTKDGAEALVGGSVLDQERLRSALTRLSPDERQAVVRGLELLAHAARAGRSAPEEEPEEEPGEETRC